MKLLWRWFFKQEAFRASEQGLLHHPEGGQPSTPIPFGLGFKVLGDFDMCGLQVLIALHLLKEPYRLHCTGDWRLRYG